MKPTIFSVVSILLLIPHVAVASTIGYFPPTIEALSNCAAYYGAAEQVAEPRSPAGAFAQQRTEQFQAALMDFAKQQSASGRVESLLVEDRRKMRVKATEMMASGDGAAWNEQRNICEAIYSRDAPLFAALHTIHYRIGALAD